MRIAKVKIYENLSPVEFNAKALELKPDDRVLVENDDTVMAGMVYGEVRFEERAQGTIPEVIRKLHGFESGERFAHYRVENEGFSFCKTHVERLGILMKLLKVKYQPHENRLVFLYSAEERVDFRELVKILAGRFHLRIEMRQINIRDECKLLGGIGVCGRGCCCSSGIGELNHISGKTSKNQCQNAAKLSGYCGRLLCCLAFDPINLNEEICKAEEEDEILPFTSTPLIVEDYGKGEK